VGKNHHTLFPSSFPVSPFGSRKALCVIGTRRTPNGNSYLSREQIGVEALPDKVTSPFPYTLGTIPFLWLESLFYWA